MGCAFEEPGCRNVLVPQSGGEAYFDAQEDQIEPQVSNSNVRCQAWHDVDYLETPM